MKHNIKTPPHTFSDAIWGTISWRTQKRCLCFYINGI